MYVKCDTTSAKLRNRVKLNITFNELLIRELEKRYDYLNPSIITERVNMLFNSQTNPYNLDNMLMKYNRIIEFIGDHNEKTR